MKHMFAVYDENTAVLVKMGSYEECQNYIQTHDGDYYIEEA